MIPPQALTWFARRGAAGSLGLSLVICGGCGKKAESKVEEAPAAAAAPAAPAPALTGEAEVRAALDRKDYDAAMASLLNVRRSANTDEKQIQFMTLAQEVKLKLIEVEATDPKAREGLAVLRSMTLGR